MDSVKSLNFIIIGMFFIFCGSVYPIIFGANLLYILLLVISLLSLLLQKIYNKQYLYSFLSATIILIVALSFNWILTGFDISFSEYPVLYGMIIIFNLAILALVNKGDFSITTFDSLFILLVIYSLLNFIVSNVLKSSFTFFSNDGYGCFHFNYLFFFVPNHDFGDGDLLRNQGFYWEPGVLAIVMNIFLFRLLFGNKLKFSSVYILLTSLVIFSTMSTTGLVVLFLQFIYYFLQVKTNRIRNLIILILFSILATPLLVSNIQKKVLGDNETSFLLRNYDALVALDITKDNFLTGVGFSKIRNKEAQENSQVYFKSDLTEAHGNTNSIITVFLYLGIPLGIIYLIMLYKQKIINYNKKLFFFILLICLASEPIIFSGFFIVFVSSYFYNFDPEFKNSNNLKNN